MDICRACMTKNGPMKSLFSFYKVYAIEFTLSEVFTSCTSLQVLKDDGLPEQLCSECVIKLKQWFTFRETSIKSDVKLRSVPSKNVIDESESLLDDDLDSVHMINPEVQMEDAEVSPVFILVVNDDNGKQELESDEIMIKQEIIMDETDNTHSEVRPELSLMIPEENVTIENNIVENEDDENLRIVKKDHAYANKKQNGQLPKNYYHCRWCLQIFTDLKTYEKHVSEGHGTVLKCKKCDKIFQTHDKFSDHICCKNSAECDEFSEPAEMTEMLWCNTDSEYDKFLDPKAGSSKMNSIILPKKRVYRKEQIKCTHCNKSFKSLWRLKTHMLVHTGERPHMCHICGKRFSQKPHLKTHYFTHTGIKNYICEMCGKKFATVSFLKNHMRYHDDKTKNHTCAQCSKTFFLPSALKAHMRMHTGERPYKCVICSKSFRVKAAMKTHQLRHGSCELQDVGRPYWCNVCNRTFTKEVYLENHLKSAHSGENQNQKFFCKVCGREFRTKNTLKMHSIRHTSSRPFLCTICNRNFKEEANLIAHIKFHARPKPFECETCHKRFIDRCALRVHNRTHTGERPFACELCEKRFTVKRSLEAHMRCHTGERPFACSICKNTFTQRCSLQTHMLLMHNCDP